MSTLRDAHVSHNSIPGPQGVQPSGETAPVMGRSSHHHARIAIDWTPSFHFQFVMNWVIDNFSVRDELCHRYIRG